MKTLLQVILAFFFGVGGYFYFGIVMPSWLALTVGVVVALMIVFSMIGGKFDVKSLNMGGLTITLWPLGGWLTKIWGYAFDFSVSDAHAATAALFMACFGAQVAYTIAERRDRARDIATISLGLIAVYTVGYAILAQDIIALAIAAFGVAAAALVLKQQLILPPRQDFGLKYGSIIAACVGIAHVGGAMLKAAF